MEGGKLGFRFLLSNGQLEASILLFEKSELLFAFGPRLKTDDAGSHQPHCGGEAILALKTGDSGEQVRLAT